MKFPLLAFFAIAALAPTLKAKQSSQPCPKRLVANSTVESCRSMAKGLTPNEWKKIGTNVEVLIRHDRGNDAQGYVFRVKAKDGMVGIFKPHHSSDVANCDYEVFASQLNDFLEFDIVPKTRYLLVDLPENYVKPVFEKQDGRVIGSFQKFIENAVDGNHTKVKPSEWEIDRQEFFDYLLGMADRDVSSGHNVMLTPDGHLILMDNGMAFAGDHPVLTERAQRFLRSPRGVTLRNLLIGKTDEELKAFVNKPGIHTAIQKLLIERLKVARQFK